MGKRAPLSSQHPAERVYWKNGAFHYVDKSNKWHRLGEHWDRGAREKWASLSTLAPGAGTVAQMLDNYLDYLRAEKARGAMSARHVEDRERDAAMLNRMFGKMDKLKVRREHVALYLKNRTDKDGNHAPVRANREVSLLSAAFNRDVTVDVNPCLGVPRNKEHGRERYVEGWELRRFAKRCCPPWLRGYILIKYLTGLRMADMLRLHDPAEGERGLVVRIGKSRKRKVLEFRWTWALRTAVGFVRNVRHGQAGGVAPDLRPLFGITPSGLKSAWRRACAKWAAQGNTPFWEHDIRGKTGSDSKTLTDAQHRLGHDRSTTTARHYRRGVSKVDSLR